MAYFNIKKYEIIITIPLVVVLPPLSVSNRTENFYLASSVFLVTKRISEPRKGKGVGWREGDVGVFPQVSSSKRLHDYPCNFVFSPWLNFFNFRSRITPDFARSANPPSSASLKKMDQCALD